MKHSPDFSRTPKSSAADKVSGRLRLARPARVLRTLGWSGLILSLLLPRVGANPTGPTVARGGATFTSQGSQLTVQAAANTFINWQSFNIGAGETTMFVQPSSSALVWNRINDPNPSQILGHLDANGLIVLQNASGFYIGGQAAISTGGLILTTAAAPPPDFAGTGMWQFNTPPPAASIINYGQVHARAGGSVFLIAHDVENRGTITAPGGNIGLCAGKQVLVSERPDGRGLSAEVVLPEGSVDNSGKLITDAGTIAMHAEVVNQGGLIQANSVRQRNGVIELVASDAVNLGADSSLQARGGNTGVSSGGQITVRSGGSFSDVKGSSISVAGGARGGDGGSVEISAPSMGAVGSAVDGHAARGSRGGELFLDPTDIVIGNSGSGTIGSGTVTAGSSPNTLNLNVNSAFIGFSQIDLQATHTITLSANTTWNLFTSTHQSGPGCQLTLETGTDAGSGIIIKSGASILGGAGWSVNLEAGRDFSLPNTFTAAAMVSGVGDITFQGSGGLQTQDGSITLLAGNNITVNGGYVRTMNNGSINATAVAGSVNTGNKNNGFYFTASRSGSGYSVDPGLGGISTYAGGDVTITAGGDVTSMLPTTPADAGSGAFGSQPGNVTITAGGNVYGHYVLANGVGTITAGQNAGTFAKSMALSLMKGGWNVDAPNGSIFLQEVRNPNGMFNEQPLGAITTPHSFHLFDYDPSAYVNLNAGISVQLGGGGNPPRVDDVVDSSTLIFPPSLSLQAGAGGVVLADNVILFPSPHGEMNITTTGGGSLQTSQAGTSYNLAMSDSGSTRLTGQNSFLNDHAAVPVQINNPNPIVLKIAGDVMDVNIVAPKAAQITVGGEMDNCSFSGQNLHRGDVTSINVAGRIFNRSDLTFFNLGSGQTYDPKIASQIFQNAVVVNSDGTVQINPDGSPDRIFSGGIPALTYLPATKQLVFEGMMDGSTEQKLMGNNGTFHVLQYGPNGNPLVDVHGHYVTKPETLADPSIIAALFAGSQDVNTGNQIGYLIGGPGQFNVRAASLDLGVTAGIISQGPGANRVLAGLGSGATINLNLTGDLSMYSSTIASYFGGDINIYSGGSIDVGNEYILGSANDAARGIYTSGRGSVNVTAVGNIDVAGSRIAAYNGGNIDVESLQGNVNAGSGGIGTAKFTVFNVDPVTGAVSPGTTEVNGSGILATTVPGAPLSDRPGDITVTTPRGDIVANKGGIIELALNGNNAAGPTVTLTAGTRDANGKVIYAGNIDVSGSGVVGETVNLSAAGNITGLVVAQHNSTINAAANFSGTVLAGGTANVSGQSISGTIIAVGGINASGDAAGATFLSQNAVNVGGQQVASGLATSVAASSTSQSAVQEDNATKNEAAQLVPEEDDATKRHNKAASLKKVGRVTVILPKT